MIPQPDLPSKSTVKIVIYRNSFKILNILSEFQCTNWMKLELEPDDSQFSGKPAIGMDEL